jgi:hypothetical protein
MKTSETINEIAAAMCKAQGAMRPALKDATNPAYRSKYADLTAVWDACREPLTKNGITVWQDVTCELGGVSVTTRLVHTSGQWVEFGPLTVPLAKPDAHGVGSATSYGKRYGLSAAIGVVSDDDDDGNGAVGRTETKATLKVPDGYERWLDDFAAVADEGTTALQAMWTKSKVEYRQYLAATNKVGLDALKAKAAKVTTPPVPA